MATARRAPRDTAEVIVRSLGTAEVSAVVREKLARVAIAAQLSARERTVLDLLLLGQRSDEIADALRDLGTYRQVPSGKHPEKARR